MEVFLILSVITTAAAIIAAARFCFLRRGLGAAAELLRKINERQSQGQGDNQKMIITTPDRGLEALLAEINCLLSRSQQERISVMEREREFRKEVSNISHDLRTPLTSILGYLELLSDSMLPEQERAEYLAVVNRKAKSLQGLITSFYDLSRLEADEYHFEMGELNLYDLLCETAAVFYGDLEEAGFTVEMELQEGPLMVGGDCLAVKRVFNNLFQNILSHGIRNVKISLGQEGGQAVTVFSNETEPMKEEDVDRVFDRFFTADEMRTGQNTGLGMTIVKKLLEGMGHQVKASLSAPEGTQWFSVEIRWNLL